MNLLLIHSLVRDKQTVIDSLTEDTKYILIDYELDDLQTIKDKISAFNLSFDRIGLFQENDNNPYYQLTRRFQPSTLVDVEMQDANLDTWTEFTDLLIFCKEKGMTNFDMMDCNVASDKNWLYVISQLENKLSININASENETGNRAMQGDWILEKGNVNLIGTYFTENIKEYKYTLGGSGGGRHTIILNNKNEVYGCGNNIYGQLGIGGDVTNTKLTNLTLLSMDLRMIPEGSKVINTKCGRDFTMILLDNGMVYGCGDNGQGQLGIGNTNSPQTTLIPMTLSGKKVVNIACGSLHTIILLDDGTVYGCGRNEEGQLGIGNTNNPQTTLVPMDLSMIPIGKKIVNIACGEKHTIVLLDSGIVYGCGRNVEGQLGIGNTNNPQTTLVPMDLSTIPIGKKIVNIACCLEDTLVLLNDGTVYGCGYNVFGQLGIGTDTPQTTLVAMDLSTIPTGRKIINIACGYYHTIVLLDSGIVYGCGYNTDGQLGSPNYSYYETTLVQMVLSTIPIGKKIINIACGGYHTMVFLDDRTIYTCGSNSNQLVPFLILTGQLGTNVNQLANNSLAPMKYNNNNNPIDVTDASTATFSTIFFNSSAITQIYNGTNNLTLTKSMYEIYTYNPLQPTITINTYTATFNNKNVGTNKTVTISVNQLKDNTNNTNYLFVIPYTTTGTIIPLQLTFSNTAKTYNGNTNVSALFAPSNVVTGDIINTSSIIGNYNTKNTIANIINLTGNIGNNNYTLPSSVTGTIIPATIIPIFTSISKKNDGNTYADVTYALNGVVSGETISITYNAKYSSANIGKNIPINITGIQITPNVYSSNYVLNNTSATIYGDIINGLLQYINKYTRLNMLSKLEVKKTNTAAYAVIGYKSKKIDPLFSVFLQNL